MRKFNFHLQPVLQHRERLEDEAAGVHARAQRDYLDHLTEMQETAGRLERTMTGRSGGRLHPGEEFHLLLYRGYLADTLEQQEEAVQQARIRLQQAREEALAARRERLKLETVRDRQWQEFNLEETRAEQKEADEQGLRLVWRRK
ncbi:flagellar export protein FliJ [Desulfotomaculum copahuensis]|uniref:Flagellar FliJ protein n=1 Tax=Desulfotomaculum copahuensis TaxID=1838280 RepID=A0A1B7LBN2_9FIRM|nr:flagellar export protein FliJ [Desulfotomaculum copahuensis]OAT79931.1 flagellar export protein FliJ [Desulfotomaculum copahuensis]